MDCGVSLLSTSFTTLTAIFALGIQLSLASLQASPLLPAVLSVSLLWCLPVGLG
jgi:hypothetical protein